MKKRTLLLGCALSLASTQVFAGGEPKTFNTPDGKDAYRVAKAQYDSNGQLTGYVVLPADSPETELQLVRQSDGSATVEDKSPLVAEMVDGHIATRRMTQAEVEQQARVRARAAADEHVFTGYTAEGVAMTFKVLSETDKTCQVGVGEGNSARWNDVAIDRNYDGTITIPSAVSGYTVTTIGNGAFYYCQKLKAINIPTSVKTINFCAFNQCSELKELYIPASVESIDDYAFASCSGLEKIIVDAASAFYDSRNNCNAIIKKTYNDLILGCKNTVIPNTVKLISHGSFRGITDLQKIFIPASVTWVGGQAFNDSYNLTSIKVDESNPYLDSRDGCNAIIKKADNSLVVGCATTTIPESVTSIGYCAFGGQKLMESVTLPKSLAAIGERAFEACPALKKVVAWMPVPFAITDDVFTVRYGTFNSEASLYVPKGTKSAYQSTEGWSLFTSVYEMNEGPDDVVEDKDEFTAKTVEGIEMKFKVLDRQAKTCQVGWYSGGGSLGSSNRCIEASTSGRVTIPGEVNGYKVTKIAGAAFFYANNVTEIVIPNTVSFIDDFAFSYTRQMKALHLPASVTTISYYAFADATGRTSITVDAGNTVYDSRNSCNAVIETATNRMIAGCATTTFPATVTALAHATFYGCEDAKSFVISKSISSIGSQAFSYCRNLETLVVEEGNPIFDSREGCNAIIETATNTLVKGAGKSVIPETVVAIAENAFEGNQILEKVSIPAGVSNIADDAFWYCYNLKQVTSYIEKPFEISDDVFKLGTNKYPEFLYVPAGTKAAYMQTPAWNLFTNIVELGNEAQIDIAPLPANETDFSKDMVDEKGDVVDLSNTKVSDVLFTLNTANGDGYDTSEGCVVMNTPMSTEAVDALDMSKAGTPEFAAQFTGMVFAVSAGRGTISINLQTLGQHTLSVKIGGGAAIKIAHPDKSTVNINYNVESDTYVLIYAQAGEASAIRGEAASADNSVRIYSIGWERTGGYDAGITIPVATEDSRRQAIYSIDGRKQSGEPTTKGIYIINRRKMVVK